MRWHNLIIAAIMLSLVGAGHARSENFPRRISATPATTNSVPHVQIGITPDPAISAALLSRADEIPGVEIRETVISMPGAKGFWRDDSVVVARPQNIVGGREFAHMHPDGSLHASLSPEHALEVFQGGQSPAAIGMAAGKSDWMFLNGGSLDRIEWCGRFGRPGRSASVRPGRGYIAQCGEPRNAAELKGHRMISYEADQESPLPPEVTTWLGGITEIEHHSDLAMNNYFGVMQAAESGLGVAPLPDYLSTLNSDLVQVAPDLISPTFTLYIAYAEELRRSRRVLAFRDFIVEEIRSMRS